MRTGPPTVVLATTNGTGMGHLSRQLALAQASLGGMEPVIFSMSSAVPVVAGWNLRGEWCPGPLHGQVARADWDSYLAERLCLLVAEVGASALVFDGVYPYDGVLSALRRSPQVPFIWSRRGMWQQGKGRRNVRFSRLFAAVLEPGDLAGEGDQGRTAALTDAHRVEPITMVDLVPALTREQARTALGLPAQGPVLLLSLGSTRPNDGYAAYGRTVAAARAAGWQVAVTSPVTAGIPTDLDDVIPISVFPLVRYLAAFDAAVSASGYNAVHELIYSGVPALLVPNVDAALDDQPTRARVVAAHGLALAASPDRPAEFDAALQRLLQEPVRAELRATCAQVARSTGATEAARAVLSLAAAGPPPAVRRLDAAALNVQRVARRQVSGALPRPVAAALGRPRLARQSPRRLTPRPAGATLPAPHPEDLLVTDLLQAGMFEDRYTEHLIAGATDDYVAARAQLARRHYRWGRAERGAQGTTDPLPDDPAAVRLAALGWRHD